MTRASEVRTLVLTHYACDLEPAEIATIVGIPLSRVDRILDDHDAAQGVPHPDRVRAPVLEPLGGPAVITSRAAVSGGRDREPIKKRRQPVGTKPKRPSKPRDRSKRSDRNPPTPRHLIECGTLPGYHLHRREGTPTCQPCRDAQNQYNISKYGRKREPIVCGTYRGWKRHHRAKEKPCDECRTAYNEKMREWRKGPPRPPRSPWVHGTPEGFQRHRANKERPCEECQPFGVPLPRAIHQRRVELYEQGLTDNQIAAETGVGRHVIAKWRSRHGFPFNKEAS